MVGLVVSDTFLLTARWNFEDGIPYLNGLEEIHYTDSINSILHDESELNSILASALRQAREINPFAGNDIVVGLPDIFVHHSIMPIEKDLSRNDHIDYINWINAQKNNSLAQNFYTFGQVYFPAEENIHICKIPRAMVRTLKLTISEMGGSPKWMGPVSSLYLDGSGMSESAMVHREGNKYKFYKVQNNLFGMGVVTFSGGIPNVVSTTDPSKEITLAALGLEKSELDDIPVYCPQKLGRQAKSAWETSDFRPSMPLDGIKYSGEKKEKLPYYETNILTQMVKSNAIEFSMNFFHEPDIIDFFFTEVIQDNADGSFDESKVASSDTQLVNDPSEAIIEEDEINLDNEIPEGEPKPSSNFGFAFAILLIVGGFIGFNYLKLQDRLNNSLFSSKREFLISRPGDHDSTKTEISSKLPPMELINQSRAISSSITNLLTQTDLNRYNALTITQSFLSLEYLSGVNPNIENILGIEPSSFSVEATGRDSTIFLWYYSFDLPLLDKISEPGELSKLDLMVQLDTTLTDYSLKYFEQVFTKNQIYGPLLIWVRGKADILQASAIISNINDTILLRKFVLFNKSDKPNPRAGFYVSILED
tara:strand:- start:2079 stop:3854 length:1776 start_codon:yes stop_codon:yes gene_type:complete